MTNLEQYNQIFAEVFAVSESQLGPDFNSESVEGWDSVRQLSLTTAMEDAFDIMLDAEDIIDFNSYEKGKVILSKYDITI
ncbi:MAG: acyl carrier protein [Bacteroidales bacterium]|nr:acyl carrier protein [Bacteroidales bacterium]